MTAPKTPTEEILNLVAAMERAKVQSAVDSDKAIRDAQFLAAKRIFETVNDAICNEHQTNGGTLTTEFCLRALAIALGSAIRRNRTGGSLSGVLITTELATLILEIATEE